jgi:pyruvate,water dikinase
MRKSEDQIIIVPFTKVKDVDRNLVGSKAVNLGELVSMNLPVPNGFIVATEAFESNFLDHNLREFVTKELVGLDPSDSVRLENASKRIRNAVSKIGLDKELSKHIMRAYSSLSGFTDSYVAVRSSSPIEDLKMDSFAGQYSSFLNVKGKDEVVDKVKNCWASMYSPQNIFYALSRGYDLLDMKMAVIVQKMVQSEASGVIFTLNPIDNDDSKISIEAILGLGEALVGGEITPDNYLVEKESGKVIEKKIVPQEWMLVRKGRTKRGEDPNIKVKVSDTWKSRQKLENKYISKLVKVGKEIEKRYGKPQDIEWTYEGGKIWIVQTRPVTTFELDEQSWKNTPTFAAIKSKFSPINEHEADEDKRILLTGRPTNAGVVSGKVKIQKDADFKKLETGTIFVADHITSDFEGKLNGVVAIVTDEAGRDSYETIMAKSLGIPCVVDTNIASKVLRNGELVTVNADKGEVFAGETEEGLENAERLKAIGFRQKPACAGRASGKRQEKEDHSTLLKLQQSREVDIPEPETSQSEDDNLEEIIVQRSEPKVKTATKIYAYIEDPNEVPRVAKKGVDGIYVRIFDDIIKEVGIHPQMLLQRKQDKQKLVDALSLGLFRVAKSFEPGPVIYKLTDLTSKVYASLGGGKGAEVSEENALTGFRGARRLIENPDELEMELSAVKKVRNKENAKNVSIAVPYARTSEELKELKKQISALGLRRSSTFKIFLVVQVPSNVIEIEEYIDLGIDGVVIDIDTLSQLVLGVDKDNPKVSVSYKDINDSLLWMVQRVIKACNKSNIHSQVTGQILNSNTEFIKELVKGGVTSISVDGEFVDYARESVYEAERELISRKK